MKDKERIKGIIEAILFTMGESVAISRLSEVLDIEEDTLKELLEEMKGDYAGKDRGICLIELDGAYQICTKIETYEYVKKLVSQPKKRSLTDVMLETLSIVAYKQPVTKQEIEAIRGVKSDFAVNKLLEYRLIKELGRLDTIGHPIVFGTTEEFLRCFGVSSIEELPDIDEVEMMREVVMNLQSITSLPLKIDTVDQQAMEAALRIYNGKPMVNSVNGKQESMDQVFPLIKKYGGAVVALTIDEDGIPQTVEKRVEIAGKIITEAAKYGIPKKDIVIDVLTMTISSEPEGARITLESLRKVREIYGVCTVLGVSNISFGLPYRPAVNSNFYTMAMQNGLSAGIINPLSEDMMRSYYSYCALMNYDENCEEYIRQYGSVKADKPVAKDTQITLKSAIEKGLKEEAHHAAYELVKTMAPLDIINEEMIPALDGVGKGFEKGTVFLPQLLMSADAAKIAFAVLKDELAKSGTEEEEKDKIILATVKGDIHDIGKNIVKVLLENYSFDVLDLGKDVPPELIVETAVKEDIKLVGLSALMTTTVVSMEETIRQLNKEKPDCKVMVGGAVLNQDYADQIHADFYGKDAMQSVHYAQKFFGMVE